LLIGGKVVRFLAEEKIGSPIRLLAEQNVDAVSGTKTPESESIQQEVIGTVTEITSWSKDGYNTPASARVIEWADGTTETVRWGVYGVYDVVHVTIDGVGKITNRYVV
jgi:hypothetical protein